MTDTALIKFVVIKLGRQEFGIPVKHIIDVLPLQKIYPIPLAPKHIMGSINLRGKIVTALDIRLLLDIDDSTVPKKCIILEHAGELFSFIVDEIGEINSFLEEDLVKTPDNLSESWQAASKGIYTHSDKDELVVILDLNAMIESMLKRAL